MEKESNSISERIYRIRLVGRNHHKDTGVSYDVYGVTIPFPEFFGKKCKIKKIDEKTIVLSVLDDNELALIDREKQEAIIKIRKGKHYKEMLKQGLITEEQLKKYMEDGVEIPPKALVAKEGYA